MANEEEYIKTSPWLIPLSWFYGMGVGLRNKLFELGVLKTRSFDIPVISVGNITVGGSGKTPHVEYLVRLLKDKAKVAVLSRGYKRQTKGFVLANDQSTVEEIGDEPLQMKQKFGDIYVAVDEDRCHGIDTLTSDNDTKDVDVILLDDAFQHRYVKPGINILLVDYHRMIFQDKLLPAGRLREPVEGKKRADIVIITKCPKDLRPMDYRVLTNEMGLLAYQSLYFTTLSYENLKPLFGGDERTLDSISQDEHVLLLTGIATPQQIITDLQPYCNHIQPLTFGDHHQFTEKDIANINETFSSMPSPKMIITTEKDACRLEKISGLNEQVRKSIYILPIHIEFMLEQEESFTNKILSYVQKNSRNSILVKGKDDNKPKDSHHTGDRPRKISFRDN
ncbi:MAG: tetraacyldisaccharide 4'-kinase [Prevotella sp.]|nr:tetraacyldisaccharide 4'-kinase [Prevotella sp.]